MRLAPRPKSAWQPWLSHLNGGRHPSFPIASFRASFEEMETFAENRFDRDEGALVSLALAISEDHQTYGWKFSAVMDRLRCSDVEYGNHQIRKDV
jgi:hypothetical protein